MTKVVACEGIVLGKRGVGEANTGVLILTDELGLVRAAARSARRDRSKLRYGLEPFTVGRFTFVQGRSEWKYIGGEKLSRELLGAPAAARAAAGRVAKLLMRLIHGEERAPVLFASAREGFVLLAQAQRREEVEALECVLVLRILFNLGYLPKTPELSPFLEDGGFSVALAAEAARSRSALIKTINESLSATGL